MSMPKSPFVEARPVRPQRTGESGEGALETSGLEESFAPALALDYKVWEQA